MALKIKDLLESSEGIRRTDSRSCPLIGLKWTSWRQLCILRFLILENSIDSLARVGPDLTPLSRRVPRKVRQELDRRVRSSRC